MEAAVSVEDDRYLTRETLLSRVRTALEGGALVGEGGRSIIKEIPLDRRAVLLEEDLVVDDRAVAGGPAGIEDSAN